MRIMKALSLYVLFGLARVPTLSSPGANCCECDEHHFCNCSSRHLVQVPVVPSDVLVLDVSFNDLKSMGEEDLSMYGKLKTLDLQQNKLSTIHNQAFDRQGELEALDLSFNLLEYIPSSWFQKLQLLKSLNLLGNRYTALGSAPLFDFVQNLRTLKFGNPSMREVKKYVLSGVTQLDDLTFVGGNLRSYEAGSFKTTGLVRMASLSLWGLLQEDPVLVSKILQDVSHPETLLTLRDVILKTNESIQPFREVKNGRTTWLTICNVTVTDEAVIGILEVLNGSPLSYLGIEDVWLRGEGWWQKASWTHLESLRTIFIRNVEIQGFFDFSSMAQLAFILRRPTEISVINCTVFVIPCPTSFFLWKLEYLDMSQNLLSDTTIEESLCRGRGVMSHLKLLNVSGNSLKSLALMSALVVRLDKLAFLDVSHNDFLTMPQKCTWPASLRFLNLSATKLRSVTPCLPVHLTVLDLSENYLTAFRLHLPNLTELRLSGNRLVHLPDGERLPDLRVLYIQRNVLTMFNKSDLVSFSRLQVLEAGLNNFVCTCTFVAFFKTDVDPRVTLSDGPRSYVCDSPLSMRGRRVDSAHLSVFECHMIQAVSVLCAVIVLVLVLLGATCHSLHILWYLRMSISWLKAKRKPVVRTGGSNLRYDAFVSYSQRDAEWVEEILVPELESSQPAFSLCLHKRDFHPGRWIVDNIIESIEKSHRTLFVLSEHFVTSEWCRYELDFSHFRIVDKHNDSAVLILLEPIVRENIPKRFCKLRKFMNSRTYLEWPQDEDRREEFWNNLRAALKRDEL